MMKNRRKKAITTQNGKKQNAILAFWNRKGEGYIDTVVSVVASMMVIVIAMNIFSFLTIKQDLDYYAKEMIEVCASTGRTGEEANQRAAELDNEVGLSPIVSYAGTEYFNSSNKTVQYGELIVVTVTCQTTVRGLGVFEIPVTLTAKHSGLSRKYWK